MKIEDHLLARGWREEDPKLHVKDPISEDRVLVSPDDTCVFVRLHNRLTCDPAWGVSVDGYCYGYTQTRALLPRGEGLEERLRDFPERSLEWFDPKPAKPLVPVKTEADANPSTRQRESGEPPEWLDAAKGLVTEPWDGMVYVVSGARRQVIETRGGVVYSVDPATGLVYAGFAAAWCAVDLDDLPTMVEMIARLGVRLGVAIEASADSKTLVVRRGDHVLHVCAGDIRTAIVRNWICSLPVKHP